MNEQEIKWADLSWKQQYLLHNIANGGQAYVYSNVEELVNLGLITLTFHDDYDTQTTEMFTYITDKGRCVLKPKMDEPKKVAIEISLPEDEFDLLLSLRNCDFECNVFEFPAKDIRIRNVMTTLSFKGLAHILTVDGDETKLEGRISKSGRWLMDKGYAPSVEGK